MDTVLDQLTEGAGTPILKSVAFEENWSVIENIDPTDGLIITLAETASYMNKKLSELLRDQSYHPFILMEEGLSP